MTSFTGRLSMSDITVIGILWSHDFFDVWIRSMCIYTSNVFFPEEIESSGFVYKELGIFVFQCMAALILAFLVDTGHCRKYFVSIFGLCLYTLTPFFALLAIMTDNLSSAIIMFFSSSILFIISPVIYCLMFNQQLEARGRQLRVVISVLEFLNSLSQFFVSLTFPDTPDSAARYQVIVIWVMVTPLLVTLLTLVERIRRYVRGDVPIDRNFRSVMDGIRTDLRRKHHSGRSQIHVIFFKLLLLPAISLTVLDSSLSNTGESDEKSPHPQLTLILFAVQLVTIPLVEVIAALTPKLRGTTIDMAVLSLAHMANVLVLVLIISRMKVTPAETTNLGFRELGSYSRVKRGGTSDYDYDWPPQGYASFVLMNLGGVNANLTLLEGDDEPVTYPFLVRAIFFKITVTPPEGKNISVDITPTDPKILRKTGNIFLTQGRFHVYSMTGDESSYDWNFIVGIEDLLDEMAQLIIVVLKHKHDIQADGINILEESDLRINSTDSGFDKSYPIPDFIKPLRVQVPPGNTTITYRFLGTDPELKAFFRDDNVTVEAKTRQVYLVFLVGVEIINVISMRMINGPPPPTTSSPITPSPTTPSLTTLSPTSLPSTSTPQAPTPKPTRKPPDGKQVASYAIAGASLSVASVGYTHFFWVESPVRLRTTIFAIFRVTNAIAWRLTSVLFGRVLTIAGAQVLLALEVCTTVFHLVLSWVFQTKIQSGTEL